MLFLSLQRRTQHSLNAEIVAAITARNSDRNDT